MRIVHVAPTLFGPAGVLGGGERYPLELSRALARHVDTCLVTFGTRARSRPEPGTVDVRVLRSVAHIAGHPAHPVGPGLRRSLAGADIVHVHHMRAAPSRSAALLARAGGVGTVVTDHGLQGGDWHGLLPRLFDRFLTVSAYSAHELGAPRARTRVVYGGADPERFRPDAEAVRDGILFVGRITPHKGIDRLLTAVPSGTPVRIAGSAGHDRSSPECDYPALLRRLARGGRVEFMGAVADAELPMLYRRAQVFVLPSVHRTCYGREIRVSELLGLAVIEAMASGTPVVVSRIGGLPEVVEDGVTGFLVDPEDDDALRERIEQVLRDRALATRLGRAARERVLDDLTWEACADRCLDAYSELVSSPR